MKDKIEQVKQELAEDQARDRSAIRSIEARYSLARDYVNNHYGNRRLSPREYLDLFSLVLQAMDCEPCDEWSEDRLKNEPIEKYLKAKKDYQKEVDRENSKAQYDAIAKAFGRG